MISKRRDGLCLEGRAVEWTDATSPGCCEMMMFVLLLMVCAAVSGRSLNNLVFLVFLNSGSKREDVASPRRRLPARVSFAPGPFNALRRPSLRPGYSLSTRGKLFEKANVWNTSTRTHVRPAGVFPWLNRCHFLVFYFKILHSYAYTL